MKCVMCKGETLQKSVPYEELGVSFGKFKADICEKCGEIYFDENTAQKIQNMSKEKGLFGLAKKVKVAEVGTSIAIRIPKEIAEFLQIKKGAEVTLIPKDKHDLLIQT